MPPAAGPGDRGVDDKNLSPVIKSKISAAKILFRGGDALRLAAAEERCCQVLNEAAVQKENIAKRVRWETQPSLIAAGAKFLGAVAFGMPAYDPHIYISHEDILKACSVVPQRSEDTAIDCLALLEELQNCQSELTRRNSELNEANTRVNECESMIQVGKSQIQKNYDAITDQMREQLYEYDIHAQKRDTTIRNQRIELEKATTELKEMEELRKEHERIKEMVQQQELKLAESAANILTLQQEKGKLLTDHSSIQSQCDQLKADLDKRTLEYDEARTQLNASVEDAKVTRKEYESTLESMRKTGSLQEARIHGLEKTIADRALKEAARVARKSRFTGKRFPPRTDVTVTSDAHTTDARNFLPRSNGDDSDSASDGPPTPRVDQTYLMSQYSNSNSSSSVNCKHICKENDDFIAAGQGNALPGSTGSGSIQFSVSQTEESNALCDFPGHKRSSSARGKPSIAEKLQKESQKLQKKRSSRTKGDVDSKLQEAQKRRQVELQKRIDIAKELGGAKVQDRLRPLKDQVERATVEQDQPVAIPNESQHRDPIASTLGQQTMRPSLNPLLAGWFKLKKSVNL